MSRLYPCVYCTEDGYCKKYSDEEVTSWCVQGPCKDERPSNADRIRAMSDEELAVWMVQWTDCYDCVARTRGCCQSDESCASSICNWLKQEVATNG